MTLFELSDLSTFPVSGQPVFKNLTFTSPDASLPKQPVDNAPHGHENTNYFIQINTNALPTLPRYETPRTYFSNSFNLKANVKTHITPQA